MTTDRPIVDSRRYAPRARCRSARAGIPASPRGRFEGELVERTVIVTGAASARGIGRAACLRLAADGWAVAALDRDGEAVQETARLAAGAGGSAAVGLTCDV